MMERKGDFVKVLVGVGLVVAVFTAVHFMTRQPEPPPKEEERSQPVAQKQEEEKGVELPDHLRYLSAITVRVKTGMAEGSGLLVKRGETPYLLTAGYVVDGLRKEEVTKKDGAETTVVTWSPATIVVIKGDGRCEITADVVRYSGAYAVALLRLREKIFLPKSTVFAGEKTVPELGSTVWHTTPHALLAKRGRVMTLGCIYQGATYDVTTPIGGGGSGGGGIFTEEGICLGMVMLGTADSASLILPSREIRRWAKAKGVAWAVDPTIPMPSEEEMKKIPIED